MEFSLTTSVQPFPFPHCSYQECVYRVVMINRISHAAPTQPKQPDPSTDRIQTLSHLLLSVFSCLNPLYSKPGTGVTGTQPVVLLNPRLSHRLPWRVLASRRPTSLASMSLHSSFSVPLPHIRLKDDCVSGCSSHRRLIPCLTICLFSSLQAQHLQQKLARLQQSNAVLSQEVEMAERVLKVMPMLSKCVNGRLPKGQGQRQSLATSSGRAL